MLHGETDDVDAPYNDDTYDALFKLDLPTTSSQLEVFHFFYKHYELHFSNTNYARAICKQEILSGSRIRAFWYN